MQEWIRVAFVKLVLILNEESKINDCTKRFTAEEIAILNQAVSILDRYL